MKNITFCLLILLSTGVFGQDTITVQSEGIEDAWLWSIPARANVNFGEANALNQNLHNVIRAENWEWMQGRTDTIRSVMRFDLSTIPHNVKIEYAELNLRHFANPNFMNHTGQNDLQIALVKSGWDESQVTWNNKPSFENQGILTFPRSTSATQDYEGLNITSLIDSIYQSQKDWSILLKMENETGFRGVTFASSEHANPTLRPYLNVVYREIPTSSRIKIPAKESDLDICQSENGVCIRHSGRDRKFWLLDANGRILKEGQSQEGKIYFNLILQSGTVFILRDSMGYCSKLTRD